VPAGRRAGRTRCAPGGDRALRTRPERAAWGPPLWDLQRRPHGPPAGASGVHGTGGRQAGAGRSTARAPSWRISRSWGLRATPAPARRHRGPRPSSGCPGENVRRPGHSGRRGHPPAHGPAGDDAALDGVPGRGGAAGVPGAPVGATRPRGNGEGDRCEAGVTEDLDRRNAGTGIRSRHESTIDGQGIS
jgi:hypothetical protein